MVPHFIAGMMEVANGLHTTATRHARLTRPLTCCRLPIRRRTFLHERSFPPNFGVLRISLLSLIWTSFLLLCAMLFAIDRSGFGDARCCLFLYQAAAENAHFCGLDSPIAPFS